jgi:plasmid stabilization system protein ParE
VKYGFHVDAQGDYTDAIHYYLGVDPRLAEGFMSEIEHGINAIRRNPLTWQIIEDDVRRYLVHRFPFGIYYTYENDSITIWAVMHLSREPNSWKHRRSQ